jgi:hypothetical protein
MGSSFWLRRQEEREKAVTVPTTTPQFSEQMFSERGIPIRNSPL